MKTSKGNSFRDCQSKGVGHYPLCFDRDSKASSGVGELYRGQSEGFSLAWIIGWWHGKGILCDLLPAYLNFSGWS